MAAQDLQQLILGDKPEVNETLTGRDGIKALFLHDCFNGFRGDFARRQQYACQRMCLQGHNVCAFVCMPFRQPHLSAAKTVWVNV